MREEILPHVAGGDMASRKRRPSEGAKPPEEERSRDFWCSAEGLMSYRLMGVAASDPVVGFKSLAGHQ